MRILITNCALRGRSGTEIVTMDLAVGLRRRGHEVAVFTPIIGNSAEFLRRSDVFVTDQLEELPWVPAIIHGHHKNVLAAAVAYFPNVPCLFVSHSSNYWFDGALSSSRVRRFCAVDEACRERLVADSSLADADVQLLQNAVDLDIFTPRPPLPPEPRRALLLAKNGQHINSVREAAAVAGLVLDEIGDPFGNVVDDLHDRLKAYDIVFATARMALEALAVGCAVVVVDGRGLAGLATSRNVDEWRRHNFGLRLLVKPLDSALIVDEIRHYQAGDAALVSEHVRKFAALSSYLDQVEMLHGEIVDAGVPSDAVSDLRDLGRFIAQWLRRLGEGVIPENFDQLVAANEFAAVHQALVQENAALRERLKSLESQVSEISDKTRVNWLRRYL